MRTWLRFFLFASALVEHIFPPYPGDLAVASGAALAVARHWSVPVMYACAVAGSGLGAALSYGAGHWLDVHAPHTPRVQRWRDAVKPASEMLRARGASAIVFSRFVPVGRAVVIVAAGYAGVPVARALVASLAGAALWIGVLFAAGITAGLERDRIGAVLAWVLRAGWGVLALFAIAAGVWWWRARRAKRAKAQ